MSAANILFSNYGQAKLATPPVGVGGLTFSIAAGKGALFPAASAPNYFYGIFTNSGKTVFEVVKIITRAGDAFTIDPAGRGLDGTTAQTWTANDTFYYGLTAIMLGEFFAHITQAAGAHAGTAISNTPAGNIAATDVQAAINELDAEKLGLATGGTVTGPMSVSGGGNVWSTGDTKLTLKTVADTGWVMENDGTIGSAASGATTRANADTAALYTLLWTNFVDADCPVTTGRGANAGADFAANKPIRLPLAMGRALAIGGAGAGLTARTIGHAIGEENHILTVAEMPAHAHGVTDPGHSHTYNQAGFGGQSAGAGGFTIWNASTVVADSVAGTGISIQNNGGGGGHNVIQPTNFRNSMIKL